MAASTRRPLSLHPLIGHERVRQTLASAHARDTLPSALLIHGERGVGKQHLALWLARLLVCQDPSSGPCERCGPCKMASSLEHPDIHWYFPLPRPKNASGDRLVVPPGVEHRDSDDSLILVPACRSGGSAELRQTAIVNAREDWNGRKRVSFRGSRSAAATRAPSPSQLASKCRRVSR